MLELLLANHPLDCPVCDKGGECPLQDNTFNFGPGDQPFYEEKRHHDKPFALSDADRCSTASAASCATAASASSREIPGDEALTVIDRGSHSEIGVPEGGTFDSPFSGNTIELCPVGALTSIPLPLPRPPLGPHEGAEHLRRLQRRLQPQRRVPQQRGAAPDRARATRRVDDGWLCDRGRFTYDYVNSRTGS